ncbi:MAG: hypothetical protein HFJ32_03520 [Clostridia bacterium]|nr:hypothetical protein [Clostridia bacterium]
MSLESENEIYNLTIWDFKEIRQSKEKERKDFAFKEKIRKKCIDREKYRAKKCQKKLADKEKTDKTAGK